MGRRHIGGDRPRAARGATTRLGTAFLGDVPETQAVETIRHALASGATLLDTAPRYGAGLSERRLGIALAGVPRASYVLSSKVGWLLTPDGGRQAAFDRDGVLRSIEASLRRLRTDRIDILHIHGPDDYYRAALGEASPTLAALRDQGVVGAIGAGMNQWRMLADFARHADFDSFLLAGRYTLLEQGALDELFPLCQARGIALFLGGVFNSGILATGDGPGASYNYAAAPPAVAERVRRLGAACARHAIPLRVAAVQFPLAHPAVSALILGARSAAEVAANLAALHAPIPPALWTDLRAAGLLDESAPVPQLAGTDR